MNLQLFDEAANAFYGVKQRDHWWVQVCLKPSRCFVFLIDFQYGWSVFSFFYREAVDAPRKFHGKDKIKVKPKDLLEMALFSICMKFWFYFLPWSLPDAVVAYLT